MIDQGLAHELHEHVDAYVDDQDADAVLKLRPDRIVLVPLPTLVGATDGPDLLERADRRTVANRQWMRSRLVEDPVLYRDDLTAAEWGELRRRLGDEERMLDEMFGLAVEARAEGVAAVDALGDLSETRFPRTGTEGHAALLLLDRLEVGHDHSWSDVVALLVDLAQEHRRRWSKVMVEAPERLAHRAVEQLVDVRLARRVPTAADPGARGDREADAGEAGVRLLPGAARFQVTEAQGSLL
jgi:uncharacterized protein (TIGR02678 family)